ncbi:polyprenyl synthetase family protein [soil metagenome]
MAVPPASPRDTVSLIRTVNAELEIFLDSRAELLLAIHPDLALLVDTARAAVLSGGKRLRPTFAYWGWRSVQRPDANGTASLVRAAASLELLHACALVHDDVMDASATRRGEPAAHLKFAAFHSAGSWPGSATSFGAAGAILLGDLLLSWSEEMFTRAIGELAPQRARRATDEFDSMRTEVVGGQFLDVLAQGRGAFDPAEALRVIEFKTSRYTIQRPLLMGARAGGASAAVCAVLDGYGHAAGEAFQLRDDLLGVFGDPAETGKPAGDDLREGKRTLLVALAAEVAAPAELSVLRAGIGNPSLDAAGVADLREVLTATGARNAVEKRIVERAAQAQDLLDSAAGPDAAISADALAALSDLAQAAAHRNF